MKLFSSIGKFFREVREKLSNHPIIYAIIGAVGIVLSWRGIWHTADFIAVFFLNNQGESGINYANLLDSIVSMTIGFVLLLFTGLFVSDFIGSQIKTEKKIEKMAEETESEEKTESERLDELEDRLEKVTDHLDEHLENIERKLGK